MGEIVFHAVDHDVDVEFASDAVVHDVDAHLIVTYDVTWIPRIVVHDDQDDLIHLNDD